MGCSCSPSSKSDPTDGNQNVDQAKNQPVDGGQSACGNNGPGCNERFYGPPQHPFPLQSDAPPDPNESDNGVGRDANGYLILTSSSASFHYLWISNTDDWNVGTLSKIDTRAVKEVARYASVTCYSNAGGSRAACDGENGCCARDDYPSYARRVAGQASGPHQAVQLTANYPSRTAVDWNGDVWVGNRAFAGQASVTKIANSPSDCVERNGAPGIQTSSDVDGNGVIDTDCNGNHIPDDLADVAQEPCKNGKPQEFYGFDDECILFTTNVNQLAGDLSQTYGRPLALGRSSIDAGPSDAWAGSWQDGRFFRIDGTSGLTQAMAQMPGNQVYGATVDESGIAWVVILGGGLYYFDTGDPNQVGTVRAPVGFSPSSYGISLDRDQNLWTGGWQTGNAYRYTPDRSSDFAALGKGYWTQVTTPGAASGASGSGRGVAADLRSQQAYFVWMARDGDGKSGWIARIDASTIALPSGADKIVSGVSMPALQVAGDSTIGAGIDTEQNIWGISKGGSVATRIKVDAAGNMTKPDITGGINNQGCPVGAGDRCTLTFAKGSSPDPYTYSDFTGFGLRNFTNPKGDYRMIQKGCSSEEQTVWIQVNWDADLPPSTMITMRARSGETPSPDNTWGAWTGDYALSPANLDGVPGPLLPNPAPYLQVEFDLSTSDHTTTPKLKSFDIVYQCKSKIG